MRDIDFIRDGRVGDKVWDARYGNGTIMRLDRNLHQSCCVAVTFSRDGRKETFTKSGQFLCGVLPSLCWGHRETVDQGQPPERSDFVATKPTWCWVWNNPEAAKCRKLIYSRQDGLYEVIPINGVRREQLGVYAEPCPREDIPDWWPKEWV